MIINRFSTNCNAVTYEQFTYNPDKFTKKLIEKHGRKKAFYLINLLYNRDFSTYAKSKIIKIDRWDLYKIRKSVKMTDIKKNPNPIEPWRVEIMRNPAISTSECARLIHRSATSVRRFRSENNIISHECKKYKSYLRYDENMTFQEKIIYVKNKSEMKKTHKIRILLDETLSEEEKAILLNVKKDRLNDVYDKYNVLSGFLLSDDCIKILRNEEISIIDCHIMIDIDCKSILLYRERNKIQSVARETHEYWTDDEINVIKDQRLTDEECATILNRTSGSVFFKRRRL